MDICVKRILVSFLKVNEPEQLVDYEFAQREICMNDHSSGKTQLVYFGHKKKNFKCYCAIIMYLFYF